MSGVVLGVMGWLPGGGNLAAAAVRLFVESIVGLVSYIVAVWALLTGGLHLDGVSGWGRRD